MTAPTEADRLAVALADRLICAGVEPEEAGLLAALGPQGVRGGALQSTRLVATVGRLAHVVRLEWAGAAIDLLTAKGMPLDEARAHVAGVLICIETLQRAGRHFWADADALFREASDG